MFGRNEDPSSGSSPPPAPVYCFGDAETLNKTSTSLLHSQDGASSHGMLIGQILHSAYAK
ncbi:hypothetical protein GYH30_019843 [Glycine max]|nr:hypothetical protein GYH30_019843 [Glycine max]